MKEYPDGAKQRFLQLVFSYGQLTKEPIYSKDEVNQIMKKEFNMTDEEISAMAKQLHSSNQMVIDTLEDNTKGESG